MEHYGAIWDAAAGTFIAVSLFSGMAYIIASALAQAAASATGQGSSCASIAAGAASRARERRRRRAALPRRISGNEAR
jgi:hypothetical protein